MSKEARSINEDESAAAVNRDLRFVQGIEQQINDLARRANSITKPLSKHERFTLENLCRTYPRLACPIIKKYLDKQKERENEQQKNSSSGIFVRGNRLNNAFISCD